MLLLALFGAALFSIAAGFCIYPAIQGAIFELLSLDNDEIDKEALLKMRSLFVSKKIRIRWKRRNLSGWLFLPTVQKKSPKRILVLAPEGRAVSIKDLAFFLKEGFIARAGCKDLYGRDLPAIFLPAPAELFKAGTSFSFGAKEAKALKAWSSFFSSSFPSSAVLFCGKGLGAISALFAATRLSRRAASKSFNLGGVIADLPRLSVTQSIKSIIEKRLPSRALYMPIYAGARIAAIFCGLSIGGRSGHRALKRLLTIKKKHPSIIVELKAK